MSASNGKHVEIRGDHQAPNASPAAGEFGKPGEEVSEKVAHEIARAEDVMLTNFFAPAIQLLLALTTHDEASVRIYAATVLGGLVIGDLPTFTLNRLTDVAWQLRLLAERDPDPRVRGCAAETLKELMETAIVIGTVRKAGQK